MIWSIACGGDNGMGTATVSRTVGWASADEDMEREHGW